jgi:hypothetical protein
MISTEENKENEDTQDIEFFARHFLLQKEIQNCQSMGLRTTKSAALTKNIIGCARKARKKQITCNNKT